MPPRKRKSTSSSIIRLTTEDLDSLLSQNESELEQFLSKFTKVQQTDILRQLYQHQSPRERAENSTYEFVVQAWSIIESAAPFVSNWHIVALCQHLDEMIDDPKVWAEERISTSKIQNLLVNIPPGCMKSLLCNVFFPAKVWAKYPATRFFCASYSEELTNRDSRLCRRIVDSPWYKANWPDTRITPNDNRIEKFTTTAGGWRMSSTVGGHGTGEHPHYIIVDDPMKAADAESEAERKNVNERWWDATMGVRGWGVAAKRIVIMQRLAESDLSGHILAKDAEKGKWTHICLCMRHEPGRMIPTPLGWTDPRQTEGELLWPAYLPEESVQEAEANLGPFQAPGQLQQRPTRAGGGVIQTDKFTILDALPFDCRRFVRYWDKAATLGAGDATAGILVTYSASLQKTIVADVRQGRWEYDERNRVMLQQAKIDADLYGQFNVRIRGEQEPGSGGKESAGITTRELSQFDVQMETVTGNKKDRAGPFAGQVNAGNVCLLLGTWNQKYIAELSAFPVGDHDDMVDGSSGAYNKLKSWLATEYGTDRSIVKPSPEELAERIQARMAQEIQEDEETPVETKRLAGVMAEIGLGMDDD